MTQLNLCTYWTHVLGEVYTKVTTARSTVNLEFYITEITTNAMMNGEVLRFSSLFTETNSSRFQIDWIPFGFLFEERCPGGDFLSLR